MNKTINKLILLTMTVILSIGVSGCDNKKKETVKKLYKEYSHGEIKECKYNGEEVYCAMRIDVGNTATAIYDKDGKQIGLCDYGKHVDLICFELTDCKVVYRVKYNREVAAVDKYGIRNKGQGPSTGGLLVISLVAAIVVGIIIFILGIRACNRYEEKHYNSDGFSGLLGIPIIGAIITFALTLSVFASEVGIIGVVIGVAVVVIVSWCIFYVKSKS